MSTYKGIADVNEQIIKDGWYAAPSGAVVEISALVAAARASTVSYRPEDLDELAATPLTGPDSLAGTRIEVTAESSMVAARRLVDATGPDTDGRVAVLNFASARNAGGGYRGGARAQEEDLCRVSALYTTLLEAPDYYAAHRASKDLGYSHRVIYSPDVPVYRDARYQLLERPYRVSFLTSPAPNAGGLARDRPDEVAALVPRLLAERAERVLAVAARHDQRSLVLGAWGCGVFRNDPAQVANAFRRLLTGDGRFAGVFEQVTFAVFDKAKGQPNLNAFRAAFAEL